jgi:hypothetical protein
MSGRMIDLLAALLILLAIVKLLVLSIHTPTWLRFAKMLYANRTVMTIVFYALAGLVLYILLQSGLTIVQILAVSLFSALLLIPGFAPYMGEVLRALKGQTFGQMMREQWHYTVVWTVLLFWGAYELLLR